jgi:four helix bundle protein
MFDFEKLDVYQVVKEQHVKVIQFLNSCDNIDSLHEEYWKKASISSVINLAQGTGRKNTEEKKEFLTIARDNIFESAIILQSLKDLGIIDEITYLDFYNGYEKASKMLLGMYRSYTKRDINLPMEENYNN